MLTKSVSSRPTAGRLHIIGWQTLAVLRQPATLLGIALLLLLGALVILPLYTLVSTTLTSDGQQAWIDVLRSNLSTNLFWRPLGNTMLLGVVVASATVLLGGLLAWLVMLTDMPGRNLIGLLAAIPYALPSFTAALAWETLFRNDRIGGQAGLLHSLGLNIPDWLAWGFLPIAASLTAHYIALGFTLISAALATINTDLLEAANLTGAKRSRVFWNITLPVVAPTIASAGLLAFAEAISNFASAAILGLPVRFHTISTRLYGAIQTGQTERGMVLALLMIVIAAFILWVSTRIVARRTFATMSGKGTKRQRQPLGVWRWPAFAFAFSICAATTLLPLLILVVSSLAQRSGDLTGGLTLHYWLGGSNPALADGQAGILFNPQITSAMTTTLLLALSVSLITTIIGLMIGYVVTRSKAPLVTGAVNLVSFLPFLIPGVAFGALYIGQFGQPFGPLPALYGTFALLILAGAVHTLPFAARSGTSSMGQVAGELEEAALVTGAGLIQRLRRIFLPLTIRGLLAGATLVFVKMARDLSLVVLLVVPTTPVLSILAFRYASEGFAQFANAITVVIALISVGATLLARRLQGASQPWNDA
jgi:iron(III) transport system permease protein